MPGCAQGNNVRLARPALLLAVLTLSVWLPLTADDSMAGAGPAPAAPVVALIIVEDPGCPYCARWDEEVGMAYAASAEGRFAPLVRRRRADPDVKRLGSVIYSPTFILVRGGVEIGRIVGYPGPDFFWGLLGNLLREAGFRPESGSS